MLRKPFVYVASALFIVAFALELGSRLWLTDAVGVPDNTPRPGIGIPSLAEVDGLLAYLVLVIALGTAEVSPYWIGRLYGLATIIVAILTLLASLGLVFAAFSLLMLMLGLIVSAPFGTAVYAAVFGHFNRPGATITLGILMTLKIVATILMIIGASQFLKSKSLILLFATSIGLTFLLTFLHGFASRFLASITDAIGAIIVFVLAIIWAIVYLIGGIIALIGNFQRNGRETGSR